MENTIHLHLLLPPLLRYCQQGKKKSEAKKQRYLQVCVTNVATVWRFFFCVSKFIYFPKTETPKQNKLKKSEVAGYELPGEGKRGGEGEREEDRVLHASCCLVGIEKQIDL